MLKSKGPSFSVVGSVKSYNSKPTSKIKLNKLTGATFKLTGSKYIKKGIASLISFKPMLVDLNSYLSLGYQSTIVGYDFDINQENTTKSMSPRLMNYVEPYEINGNTKSLFYTEFNSGLNVGDRVFIINGNYDSDILIKKNKYRRGRDGYKILYIDKCQIVLDIDFTGVLPNSSNIEDKFIKVHFIDSVDDFSHAERQTTTRGGTFSRRFDYHQDNIIFTNKNYATMSVWGNYIDISSAPGFFIRNGSQWIDITSQFILGSYSLIQSTSSNDRIKIINGSFTYSINGEVVGFQEDNVYKIDMSEEPNAIRGSFSTWVVDVTYNTAIISKTNFRDGNFDGVWNSGLFGRQNKRIKWEGDKSTWNLGTLLNTDWLSGDINSKFTLPESYFTEFDEFGTPFQKVNAPNNNGRGFNLLIDSIIRNATIENSNVVRTVLGSASSDYSVIENDILSTSPTYSIIINKGYFDGVEFNNSYIKNSEIRNGKSNNSKLENIKSVNSYYKQSHIINSDYISDEIIKILDYDEFNISEYIGSNGSSHKVYKFYIDKISYERLKLNDTFYIKGLNINNGTKTLLNFFDKRFKIGVWNEYIDFFYDPVDPNLANPPSVGNSLSANNYSFYKRGIDVSAFLSTPGDNEYTHTSVFNGTSYYSKVVSINAKSNYSIDIVFSTKDIDFNIVDENLINFNRDIATSSNISPTMSNILGNIIDIENAYIIDSDFESGLFERSNWNSGLNFGSNNDVNITTPTIEGGYYNLQVSTSSSTLTAKTTYDFQNREWSEDSLKIGDVVYLNSVDYDTRGKIESITISNTGIGYLSGVNINLLGGNGTGATIDIISATIGSITSISNLQPGTSYTPGPPGIGTWTNAPTTVQTPGSLGTGLTVDIIVDLFGSVTSAIINQTGQGYSVMDIVEIDPNPSGSGSTFSVSSITNGEVESVLINDGTIGYSIGDLLTIYGGTATVQVISLTGSLVRLPDAYKITNINNSSFDLKEIYSTSSVTSTLLSGGLYKTEGANNRYGYLHTSKFKRSFIKSGILRRLYLYDNLIQNSDLNLLDKDFVNLLQFKKLMISDTLFANNENILSKASYVNSSFKSGTDVWNDGLFYNSVWNSGYFTKGLIKESTWMDGIFNSGTFYKSRSFNATPDVTYQSYYVDRIKSYYKSGLTTATISNNRFSWRSGTFSNGEFIKSDWDGGRFSNGKFYNSNWYSGTFSNGSLGNISLSYNDTNFYNGLIENAIVENANIYAIDTSYTGLSNSTIVWEKGIFNSGVFGCDIILQNSSSHTATWIDGVFNGGEFKTNGKWKTGKFNGGKFTSGYGWTYSSHLTNMSTSASQFGWEDGEFNAGEFGNANTGTNSTWWSGEFNGGKFQGRYWNDGVLTNGKFEGSSTYSAIGGYDIDNYDESNANLFFKSFTQSFYGLWNSGIVSDVKDDFVKNKKLSTIAIRGISDKISLPTVSFNNMLWLSGTFSHPQNAEFNNSVWLDGKFIKGKFKNSSFNPFVDRQLTNNKSFNTDDLFDSSLPLATGKGSCQWVNGTLEESDFYISNWENGTFISGTAFGMVWKNGVSNYMNAYNVFWENGTWRNGNWYGSYLKFDGSVIEPFNKQILFRGMNWSSSSELHVWNIFKEELLDVSTLTTSTASSSTGGIGTGRLFFSGVGGGGGLSTPGVAN
jgi:hypothetical protein